MRQRIAPVFGANRRLPDEHLFDKHLYFGQPIYNGALIRYGERWIQTIRMGPANNSKTYIGELDSSLSPKSPFKDLSTPESLKEDMRLFVFRRRLYGSYNELRKGDGKILGVYVGVCLFRKDLSIEAVYIPRVPGQHSWEKNWSFFEHDGSLYFVYSISPHIVYQWEPGKDPVKVNDQPILHSWGTPPRCGSPPIRIGNSYVSAFHVGNPAKRAGLYEFEAKNPFNVTVMNRNPIMQCTQDWCVRYPMSLLHLDDSLYVVYGEDDTRIKLKRIERRIKA